MLYLLENVLPLCSVLCWCVLSLNNILVPTYCIGLQCKSMYFCLFNRPPNTEKNHWSTEDTTLHTLSHRGMCDNMPMIRTLGAQWEWTAFQKHPSGHPLPSSSPYITVPFSPHSLTLLVTTYDIISCLYLHKCVVYLQNVSWKIGQIWETQSWHEPHRWRNSEWSSC